MKTERGGERYETVRERSDGEYRARLRELCSCEERWADHRRVTDFERDK